MSDGYNPGLYRIVLDRYCTWMVVELVGCLLLLLLLLLLRALELTAEVPSDALVVLVVDQILCQALQHLYRIGTV